MLPAPILDRLTTNELSSSSMTAVTAHAAAAFSKKRILRFSIAFFKGKKTPPANKIVNILLRLGVFDSIKKPAGNAKLTEDQRFFFPSASAASILAVVETAHFLVWMRTRSSPVSKVMVSSVT